MRCFSRTCALFRIAVCRYVHIGLVASIWFGLSRPGAAQAPAVVLVQPPAADAQLTDAFNRLQAELHIHAFDTRVREAELDADPTASLTMLGAREEAVAAFGFVRRSGDPSLHVVLLERSTGDLSTRRLPLARGSDAASLIAVRAVDMLRASLQEFPADPEPEPEPEPEPPPPPAAAQRPVTPPGRAFSLAAEGTMLWTGARFGVAFGPALAIFHHPLPWFRWGVWLAGPVLGTQLETGNGTATVRQELGFIETRFSVLQVGRFELSPLVGAGAYLLQASGHVRSPLMSEDDDVASALFTVGIAAEQGLGARFGLGLSVRALGLLPGLGVAVAAEREALSFPSVQASLGVVLGF